MPSLEQRKEDEIQKKMIIELLTDDVSLKILKSAIGGLKATTKNATEFGVTPRKYYRRMARLIELGLIEKYKNIYRITLLGDRLLKLCKDFSEIMASSKKLRLIDKIKRIEDVSPFDLQAIKQALGATDNEEIKSLKIVTNYEDLVKGIIYAIDSARETVIMATRYQDLRVTEPIARAVKRGVKCYFITDEKHSLALRVKLHTSLLPDMESIKAFAEMARAPNFKVRYKDPPFSFMVTDGKHVGIEFVDQTRPDQFNFGIGGESEKLAGILHRNFEDMWKVAKEIPMEIPTKN